MDTNVLMTMLLQEVDQHYLRVQRCKHRDGKRKDEEKDEALVVDQSRGKKEHDLSMIECWNWRYGPFLVEMSQTGEGFNRFKEINRS